MATKPSDLENRGETPDKNFDKNVEPALRGSEHAAADLARVRSRTAPGPDEKHPADQSPQPDVAAAVRAAGKSLEDKIAAARALNPEGKERHCVDCWQRGRDAALRVIVGQ